MNKEQNTLNSKQTSSKNVSLQNEVTKKANWWKAKTKSQKTYFIIAIAIIIISILFVFGLIFVRDLFGDEIGDAVLGEGVANGFVSLGNSFKDSLPKIIFSILTIVLCFVIAFVLNLLIKLFTSGSKRAMTTGSLIRSLIKYASILIGIGVILTIWGANIFGIIASMGILTLVIGLGCQSLISDIISGLFIVFDDFFSVGDMVIIDGFRGFVEEIGLRSIKLNDRCGNIKCITNSSIVSCVNLSRHPNSITVTLDGSYFEDVERLEAIFSRELPKIKDKLPQMIDGPFYKGIDNFDDAGISFAFGCTVKAENRFQLARDFKREIYQMFVRNDIIIPFNQIVVNSADPKDRPLASEEDKKASKKLLDKNRKVVVEEKDTFSKKLKKVTKSSVKEIEDSLK